MCPYMFMILGWVKSFAIFWYVLVCSAYIVTEAVQAVVGSILGVQIGYNVVEPMKNLCAKGAVNHAVQ